VSLQTNCLSKHSQSIGWGVYTATKLWLYTRASLDDTHLIHRKLLFGILELPNTQHLQDSIIRKSSIDFARVLGISVLGIHASRER